MGKRQRIAVVVETPKRGQQKQPLGSNSFSYSAVQSVRASVHVLIVLVFGVRFFAEVKLCLHLSIVRVSKGGHESPVHR